MKRDAARLERALVVLVALHSLAVGLMLLGPTEWAVHFGGWSSATPLFFPRQAGAFHFVVATAYLVEYFHYRGVIVLVTTKAFATVFLLGATFLDGAPWSVPLSAAADAGMGLVVWLAFVARRREEQARRPAG